MSDHMNGVMALAYRAQFMSYIINPRRLEDSTYPFWTWIISRICGSCTYLWPSPQWRLYVSPLDVHIESDNEEECYEGNTSNVTIPDPDALQVITDFAILLPILLCDRESTRPAFANFSSILDAADEEVDWDPKTWFNYTDDVQLAHLFVPGLVELKRPPPRSPANIEDYVTHLHAYIEAAQYQVEQQAICLLCSPKYAKQNRIVLIAGAGEWWCFQVVSRDSMKEKYPKFDLELYRSLKFRERLHQSLFEQGPEDGFEVPVDMNDVGRVAANLESQVRRAAETQRVARGQRAQHRAETAYGRFLSDTGAGPNFSNNQIDQWCAHVGGPSNPTNNPALLNFRIISDRDDRAFETYVNGSWSPIMRIGTKASNAYMKKISSLLQSAVEAKAF